MIDLQCYLLIIFGETLTDHCNSATSTPTSLPSTCQFQGCWTEGANGVRALPSNFTIDHTLMSEEICYNFCVVTNGYTYFGLEYAGECWCGDALDASSTNVDASACSLACDGTPDELCGGNDVLDVYYCGTGSQTSSSSQSTATPTSSSSSLSITPSSSVTPTSSPSSSESSTSTSESSTSTSSGVTTTESSSTPSVSPTSSSESSSSSSSTRFVAFAYLFLLPSRSKHLRLSAYAIWLSWIIPVLSSLFIFLQRLVLTSSF